MTVRALFLLPLLALSSACPREGDSRAGDSRAAAERLGAQRAAVTYLFRTRESARQLVLWADAREDGPVLSALRIRDARSASALARDPSLGVPTTTVDGDDMERLFHAHPDGWDAFYRRFPGSSGLVEVGTPQPVSRDGVVPVVVGRSCGEQCRQAWRVELRALAGGGWRAVRATPLRVDR